MRTFPLLMSAAFIALAPAMAFAADATPPASPAPAATSAPVSTASAPFTDEQVKAIEEIFHKYLTVKNPEVLIEASQELQKRQATVSAEKSKSALVEKKDQVYNDPTAPIGGNPKGDITVVEFFDYQCGYCKIVEPSVEKLLHDDPNVRFVYKEYPILGPISVTASKAALAANKQSPEKYTKFHNALMAAALSHGQNPTKDEELIFKIAKDQGFDVDKLKKDMAGDAIAKIIDDNVALGQDVGARGTPTFIVNNNVYPGAMDYDVLKKTVDDARKEKKAPDASDKKTPDTSDKTKKK